MLPASAAAMPVQASFAMNAPPPDPMAAEQINQQAQEADKAEQEVLTQAAPDGGGAPPPIAPPQAPPISISLGQSIEEVTGAMGQPKNIVDLGAKKIYVYKDMKITFNGGKVTDVQ